ncbi:cytidylate kinase [Geotalea daltonii FRC-32]|uniref:Cytidylate kinase n=1 Tax=Geotalea daltonii (strain DSM 22248 / JCM 15807 / FRC-32) TaxID=316067 RepID=B9LZG3_GEODF|nr:(d)CMP kinase [Geotalea daltonii]ACM20716.1 cytidylate kinase [Geotalea daltonii FRC-32]
MKESSAAGRKNGLIIAIDGPSGAGKSTITKLLAERLGYIHIDTGAMFRAIALSASRNGVEADDDRGLEELCRSTDVVLKRSNGCCMVLLNGEDVSHAIRTPEISALTSKISARKPVRESLLKLQRRMGEQGGVILEGRDIGTVVFPDAEVKFFLSASAEERGRRRYLELVAKGEQVTLEQTIAAVISRDENDEKREHAPLRCANDAVIIDSTRLSIEEVLESMEKKVRERVPEQQTCFTDGREICGK